MLKISAQSEYAMILLRHLSKTGYQQKIADISTITKIKEPILRKIANRLEKAGMIKTTKGRNGGIQLVSEDISIYNILEVMGENLDVVICSGKVCDKNDICEIGPVISNLQRGLDAILKITKI